MQITVFWPRSTHTFSKFITRRNRSVAHWAAWDLGLLFLPPLFAHGGSPTTELL